MGKKQGATKERKQKRQEESSKALQASAWAKQMNQVKDPLAALPAFRVYARRGVELDLVPYWAADVDKSLGDALFELCKSNMEAAYNTAWGWDDGAKKRELAAHDARFVVAFERGAGTGAAPRSPDAVAAFVHYRFEEEDGDATLYVYEIQLHPRVQRKGVGRFMMQLLELVARTSGADRMALTVMDVSDGAHALYAALGYTTDPGSPEPCLEDPPGYSVLSKALPKPRAPAGGVPRVALAAVPPQGQAAAAVAAP